jgi:hypothetical protein
MVKPTETASRTFTKKLRDGKVLTRQVTSAPGSEVEALYDGFAEDTSAGTKTSSAAAKPASASS